MTNEQAVKKQTLAGLGWLPSRSLLEPEAELLFRAEKAAEARKSTRLFSVLAVGLMLLFNLINQLQGVPYSEPENLLRYAAIALLGAPLLFSTHLSDQALQRLWLYLSLALILLMTAVFYRVGLRLGRLSEGGPLIVVMTLATLSFFHLGQKTILWGVYLIGLLLISLLTSVAMGWTLFYCILAVVLSGFMQYRLDVLQREHFRFELAERQKAETDKLTGALNRHSFERRLSELLAQLQVGQTLCLGMLDIDHFKRYNDHYGHLQGDACLVAVSRALKDLPLDLLVRFGGEEFIVVAVTEGAVPDYLLNLHESISALQIAHVQSPLGYVSTSVGLCTYQRQGNATPPGSHQFLAAADALLYQAKEQGRNRLLSAPLV